LSKAAEFAYFRGISTLPQNCVEFDNWPVITSIFQFKSKIAKLSDKTADLLKSTDYFGNQQNYCNTKYSTGEV